MSPRLQLVRAALVLLALGWLPACRRQTPAPAAPKPVPAVSAPDWKSLDPYQESIDRADFERLLATVFTSGDAWRSVIRIGDDAATIATGNPPPDENYVLRFQPPGDPRKTVPRHWRTADELPPAAAGQPLAGLKIAIDPGHIGGEWAKMEERWFVVGDGTPVREGNMTLDVANLLKPRLERLGASVSLVRSRLEPVTSARPADFRPAMAEKDAERMFYRTAEIRARAGLVNGTLQPDLVLCLHFNAEAWGDPNHPLLTDHTHLHLLVNGAYTDSEVALPDQRLELLRKLLQGAHQEEIGVSSTVAATFAERTGLPPYMYPADATGARPMPGEPYVWARNLLANRLYDCPVVFLEPYVMNSAIDHARIQAGDFEGLRQIGGKLLPSIYREYADAVAAGLAKHYAAHRAPQ